MLSARLKRGRGILLGFINTIMGIMISLKLLKWGLGNTDKLYKDIFWVVIHGLLLYWVYQGDRFNKWVAVVVYLATGAGGVYFAVRSDDRVFAVIMILMGLLYLSFVATLLFSKDVKLFMTFQRGELDDGDLDPDERRRIMLMGNPLGDETLEFSAIDDDEPALMSAQEFEERYPERGVVASASPELRVYLFLCDAHEFEIDSIEKAVCEAIEASSAGRWTGSVSAALTERPAARIVMFKVDDMSRAFETATEALQAAGAPRTTEIHLGDEVYAVYEN